MISTHAGLIMLIFGWVMFGLSLIVMLVMPKINARLFAQMSHTDLLIQNEQLIRENIAYKQQIDKDMKVLAKVSKFLKTV